MKMCYNSLKLGKISHDIELAINKQAPLRFNHKHCCIFELCHEGTYHHLYRYIYDNQGTVFRII